MAYALTIGALIAATMIFNFIRQRHYRSSIIDIAKVYDIMGDVVTKTNADRFLILYTTNGGGRPHIGAHLYGSVLYEYRGEGIQSMKAEFQRIPIDLDYVDMLVKIERNGAIVLKAEDLNHSLLSSIYVRDGVTCSYLFKIRDTANKYYYGSVQTTSRPGDLDIATIEMAAARIRHLFRNAR